MNQLIFGDCLEKFKYIPDNSASLILCDLPYQKTRNKWDKLLPINKLWEEYRRISKPNTPIILTSITDFTAEITLSNKPWFRYDLIWEKTQPTGFLNANIMPLRAHESILVFYAKKPTYNPQKTSGHKRKVSTAAHKHKCRDTSNYSQHDHKDYDSTERYPRSVLKFPRDKDYLHPTQKPVDLFEYLIRTYSNEGDLVVDNCAGVATTAVAAWKSKRKFICIEKNYNYFYKSCQRLDSINCDYSLIF